MSSPPGRGYGNYHKTKIKAFLGMLARLPWGRRDMLGPMSGKHAGVSVN